jgi:hypothetical protein
MAVNNVHCHMITQHESSSLHRTSALEDIAKLIQAVWRRFQGSKATITLPLPLSMHARRDLWCIHIWKELQVCLLLLLLLLALLWLLLRRLQHGLHVRQLLRLAKLRLL